MSKLKIPYSKEMHQAQCSHSYHSGEFGDNEDVPFSYCPWCGKAVYRIEEEEEWDCKKRGCAD